MSGFIQSGRFGAPAPAWLPTDLSGLVLWLDASDAGSITSSGGAVSQWNDLSGNAEHVSQSSAGAKPTTGAATINGLNVISFDGSDQLENYTISSSTWKPVSVFVVAQIDDNGNAKTFVARRASSGFQLRASNIEKLELIKSGVVGIGTATTANSTAAPSLSAVTYDASGNWAFWTNGTANGSGLNDQTFTASTEMFIGSRVNTEYFLGDIAEVLVYDTALGSTDRASVHGYLNAKWAVY